MNLKPFEWADEVDQKELLSKLPAGTSHATPEIPRAPKLPEASPSDNSLSPTKARIEFAPLFGLRHLVDVWYFINPDIPLYPWQKEELYRLSGYTTGSPNGPREHFSPSNPFLASYVCANGSGKDKVIISTLAVGLPLLYKGVYVVITSASFKQLKDQTELHITNAIKKLNAKFREAGAAADLFDIVSFHYRCPSRGAEIVLFATDESGKAEGWHPIEIPGQLVLIINEAKSIASDIFSALDRCWGYSHWVEISSPGHRSGLFYRNYRSSIRYPDLPKPFKYFSRRVDATQCPHITDGNQRLMVDKHGEFSFIVQTSLRANFWEEEEGVVIPAGMVDDCEDVSPKDETLGFGLDCAAGGDETVLVVRRGNRILDLFPFIQKDTNLASSMIDERLDAYRYEKDYVFNLDDGGVGRAFGDNLKKLGWNFIRRHNQSAAFTPAEFGNLGAEMWWHVRDLFQARKIIKPKDEVLYTQLITRKLDVSEGLGKKKLASKKRIKENGGSSPDRADAFILAFWSYKPNLSVKAPAKQEEPFSDLSDFPAMDYKQLAAFLKRHPNIFGKAPTVKQTGTYTCQTI